MFEREIMSESKRECTVCCKSFSKKKEYWPIIWDNPSRGVCLVCLTKIRVVIKYT